MLADIGIGILIAIIASKIFKVNLDTKLLLVSIILVLLPDLDMLSYLGDLSIGKWSYQHRNYLHFPLLYIPIGVIIAWQFSKKWAAIFTAGSLAHFIHDIIAGGWGVKWLFPFINKSFMLYQVDLNKWFLFLSDSQAKNLATLYGREDWVSYYYLSLHPLGVTEDLIFIFALIVLCFYKGWFKITRPKS